MNDRFYKHTIITHQLLENMIFDLKIHVFTICYLIFQYQIHDYYLSGFVIYYK